MGLGKLSTIAFGGTIAVLLLFLAVTRNASVAETPQTNEMAQTDPGSGLGPAEAQPKDVTSASASTPLGSREQQGDSPEITQAKQVVKLIINLNHRLCADVVNVQPVHGSTFHVTCTENIGGKKTIDYLVDGSDNSVLRI